MILSDTFVVGTRDKLLERRFFFPRVSHTRVLILSFIPKDTARLPGFGFGKGDSAISVLVVAGLRYSRLLWYKHQLFVSTYSHGQKLHGQENYRNSSIPF